MKTKKLLAFAFFALQISLQCYCQNNEMKKYANIFVKSDEFKPIRAAGIDFDKATGEVRIGISELHTASKLKTSGMLVAGSVSTNYYKLMLYNFDPTMTYKGSTAVPYTLSGGDIESYDRENMKTSQIPTKAFADIVIDYPAFYAQPAVTEITTLEPYTFGFKTKTVKYSEALNDFVDVAAGNPVTIKPLENLYASMDYCLDNANKLVYGDFGKKSEEKYGSQKYMVFAVYDINGKLINSFEANFAFPRSLKKKLLLKSKANPDEIAGSVFIYSRAAMIGKKYNDPEKNNYEIVACDKQGKLILHKTFKVGDADKSSFDPYYAVLDDKKVWVLGQYFDSNTYGLIVKTFGPDTLETTKEFNKDILAPKRFYDKNGSKRSDAAFDIVGLNFGSFSQDFIGKSHVLAPNGDILVWGITTSEIDDPNYKPEPGQMASMFKPKVKQFRDLVSIQINPSNDLVAIYNSLLKESFQESEVTATLVNDKVIFTAINVQRPITDLEPTIFKLPSITNPQIAWSYPYKTLFIPKFVAINTTAATITSQMPSMAHFSLFEPKKFSVIAGDKLYYFGFSIDRKIPQMKLLVDEFKF